MPEGYPVLSKVRAYGQALADAGYDGDAIIVLRVNDFLAFQAEAKKITGDDSGVSARGPEISAVTACGTLFVRPHAEDLQELERRMSRRAGQN